MRTISREPSPPRSRAGHEVSTTSPVGTPSRGVPARARGGEDVPAPLEPGPRLPARLLGLPRVPRQLLQIPLRDKRCGLPGGHGLRALCLGARNAGEHSGCRAALARLARQRAEAPARRAERAPPGLAIVRREEPDRWVLLAEL